MLGILTNLGLGEYLVQLATLMFIVLIIIPWLLLSAAEGVNQGMGYVGEWWGKVRKR